MAVKDPKGITEAGVETGAKKANPSWDKMLVTGFLAGASGNGERVSGRESARSGA